MTTTGGGGWIQPRRAAIKKGDDPLQRRSRLLEPVAVVAAQPRDKGEDKRQDGEGDEEARVLVEPLAVEEQVTGKNEQAGKPAYGNHPSNGQNPPPECVALLAPLDARFAVVEWMVAHANSLAVAGRRELDLIVYNRRAVTSN